MDLIRESTMTPQISIIIPVYNGEENISISLDSLLSQTYSNFEVVIINDGSTDNTSKIVERYLKKDNRFKYIYQENAGVAMARNKGLENTTGKYICFLDSDDYYDKTFLEKMYAKMKSANYDVTYCSYNIITPNKSLKITSKYKEGNVLIDYILGKVAIHTTGWMIKKELLQENNIVFPEGISWGEDFEFFCKVLAYTNKVTYVPEHLTNYHLNFSETQLSSFSLDKADKDYESINRLLNDPTINTSKIINSALIEYRLPALITYRLVEAIKLGEKKEVVTDYFNKYENYLKKFTWNNGFRSVKLNMCKLRLIVLLKQYIF